MFRTEFYENSRPDGFGVLEITSDLEAGPQRERVRQPRRRYFVPLQRTELKGEVLGPVAALRLIQTYGYTRAQSAKTLEAIYRFPLPGDAAVTGVRVRFGEMEIRAELKEREAATATYEQAKQHGQQAALLTRETPDVFTLRVAGLKPDETVVVETCYVQLARAEGIGWSLRLPLTTAPRYTRDDERESHQAQGQPLFVMRDPGHRFALDLTFPAGGTVTSLTHRLSLTALATTLENQVLQVQLQDSEVRPDRDCVLHWSLPQAAARPTLQVLVHDEPQNEHTYFLALVAPPATHEVGQGVAREIILLVDHSGSMTGPKWSAADWSAQRFLMDLTGRDTFDLGLFHNTTRWFQPRPGPANVKTTQAAINFLTQHRDSGGTELGVALEQALRLPRSPGAPSRHVLVVTDAEVTDAGRVLRLADDEAGHAQRRRISVLCIDAAPNSFLATELAERGGGVAKFLTSDPQQEDITTALDEVLADWAEPVLTGLRLEINRPGVEAAGRTVIPPALLASSAIDLGDLPMGRAVWVAGRVPRAASQDLTFRLTSQGQDIVSVQAAVETAPSHPALKALFGARRVAGLEFLLASGAYGDELMRRLRRLGYDPAQAPAPLYAENRQVIGHAAVRALLVREALDYGLASAETAFVVVREQAGKVIEDTVAVGNALPEGWDEEGIGGEVTEMLEMLKPVQDMTRSAPAGGVGRSRTMRSVGSPPPSPPSVMPMPSPAGMAKRVAGLFSRPNQSVHLGPQPPAGAPDLDAALLLFSGVPNFVTGEAVLFDSAQDATKLTTALTISGLVARFPSGMLSLDSLDPSLTVLIFVDDLAAPRARVRLLDVLRGGGERPLNISRASSQVVRIVLMDASGVWRAAWGDLEIRLRI